jgi:hypothetical protein
MFPATLSVDPGSFFSAGIPVALRERRSGQARSSLPAIRTIA